MQQKSPQPDAGLTFFNLSPMVEHPVRDQSL